MLKEVPKSRETSAVYRYIYAARQGMIMGCGPRKGRPPKGGVATLPTTFSEWPAAAPVLAVSETCAWVSEVEARR